MKRKNVFPFCAVTGQDNTKKALILNVINPLIGGVLISGEKGTAKSTLVRGLAELIKDADVVELPLNVTEDRLIGTIDIERAIKKGKRSFEHGILMKAHGNILYVDEVNLLSDHIVNCLLEVSSSRVNRVEREGVSFCHVSEFVMVGTMNPEEGPLRPQFLDRFGLYVAVKGSRLPEERREIVKRRLNYEKNPEGYAAGWKQVTDELSERIKKAKQLLPFVNVIDDIMRLATEIALEGRCAGHRAELALIETAKAIAAFDNRKIITIEDIKQAAIFALPHRIGQRAPHLVQEQKNDRQDENQSNCKQLVEDKLPAKKEDPEQREQQDNRDPLQKNENISNGFEGQIDLDKSQTNTDLSHDYNIEEPGEIFQIKPMNIKAPGRKKRIGSGKRSRTETNSKQGKYIRYTFPRGKLKDLAFDATLRAAAPYQKARVLNGKALAIQSDDLREKIRERRTGSTILFIVDASGSMGVKQRMKAVKEAILSLLNDAYQKRDKVGMIAFRKDSAELLLNITRSVDLAQKSLRTMPTGGKTPLAAGLYSGYELIKAAKIKDPEMIPVVVLVSDGRANASTNGREPLIEALDIARIFAAEKINSLVIDTEKGFVKLGYALEIANAMGAEYLKLDELENKEVEIAVRNMM